jgi:hypothetical protein
MQGILVDEPEAETTSRCLALQTILPRAAFKAFNLKRANFQNHAQRACALPMFAYPCTAGTRCAVV